LGEAFDIADEAQSENDVPKLVVAGHVAPPVEQGAYKIKFLKLGRPPAYSGQTSLTIRSQDRRAANAASYRFGLDGILETVVLIQYKTRDQDDGETSRFEIM
jgi:hypothetical protein